MGLAGTLGSDTASLPVASFELAELSTLIVDRSSQL